MASGPPGRHLILGSALLLGCAERAVVGQLGPGGGRNLPPGDAAQADRGAGEPTAPDGPEPLPSGRPFEGEYADPSAPPGARDHFGGPPSADPATPRVVYPLSDAMLGRNIGAMNIQWAAGRGNTIFRLRVQGDMGEARLYAGVGACPGGKCQLLVPDDFWRVIASANAGARVKLVVEGVAAPGGEIATSTETFLFFSPEDLRGGLYYWSTKLPGIMRVRLGETRPEPFRPATSGTQRCIGCHTVTRDGCRVAFTFEGCHNPSLGIADAQDPDRQYVPSGQEVSTLQAWSPDGERLVTTHRGELTVRDALGKIVARVPRNYIGPPGNDVVTHPEWSPDARWLAFTRLAPGSGPVGGDPSMADCTQSGDIMLMDVGDGSLGAATTLVPATPQEYHFYPHFSPDSSWVVFNSGRRPGRSPFSTSSSYDQTTARLRLVATAGGTPVELSGATHESDKTASWPKFSPFSQGRGNLFFIVFSSRIDYGWVLEQAGIPPVTPGLYGRPQLWVAAIDVARPGDPSYAPFWLPFQLASDGNHLGYWTTRIVSGTVLPGDCR